MTIANFDEIDQFARVQIARAMAASRAIPFTLNEQTKEARDIRASLVGDDPKFSRLETETGMAAWTVVLGVDMRKSSYRALEIGAQDTFVTMHTYLPTMAKLITAAGGYIANLRGDGLFATFGLTPKTGRDDDMKPETATWASGRATSCGKSMLEATEDILNPVLEEHGIKGDLRIGVGISFGEVVVTRIGLFDANEVTLYGHAVDQACKLSQKSDGIILHPNAKSLYPTADGGPMRFDQNHDGFVPRYPPGMYMLERTQRHLGRTWPR